MKKHFTLLIFLAASVSLYFGFGFGDNGEKPQVFIDKNIQGTHNPNIAKEYMSRWYEPYDMITPEMRDRMLQEVNQLPGDELAVNNWILYGPSGQRIYGDPGTNYYSGRILDIEVDGTPSTRLGTASGGLWGFVFIIPIPLSDNLQNTLVIGSFDSQTGDGNTILVGTGEGAYYNGAGLFKTTNGGTSYTQIAMSPTPTAFYKLRYAPGSTSVVHAATSTGYYKSTDGGDTWTRYQLTAKVTDLAIDPLNTNNIYAPVWGDGLYKSTNAGVNWTKMTSGGIPTTNFGRASISLCSVTPSTVYVNVAQNSGPNADKTLGVYKTTNAGTSWTDVKPVAEFHSFGWYNNACGVSPTDGNRIIVGGLTLWRSTNGGSSWTEITNTHADQHSVTWNAAGTSCWVGNDGGMFFSNDAGLTFSYGSNFLPITQYVIFDVLPNGQYCYGGSQDNGVSGTTNRGSLWYHYIGGDGGGAAIDPVTPSKIAVSNGVYGGSWSFRRLLTTNGGANWSFIDNGVDPSGQWYHRVRNDKVNPVYLWNNSGPHVYISTNYGTLWTKSNAAAFPGEVADMSVSKYVAGSVVYACLASGGKLRVYDGGTWFDRSTGLGTNTVRHVEPHMTNISTGYALMNGLTAGQKIYKTTNRGGSWTNISGDMPNVPMSAMIPHPTDDNKLYVGTEMGCYRSTNGGTNWHRWNNGMANATQVTEMGYIDSIAINGKFYVVSATYGRSIYYREISGDDPIGISGNQTGIPQHYELSQNYPNPFNPVTKIKFALPSSDNVKLEVFDILGKNVATLVNGEMKAGYHVMEFNASSFSSGIYFYRITTSKLIETKKMILVK